MSDTIACMEYVKRYFEYQLKQGLNIQTIIETINGKILPFELKGTTFNEKLLRRCLQLTSTSYIIDYNKMLRSRMIL